MIENIELLEHIGKTKTVKLIDEISMQYQEKFLKINQDYDELLHASAIITILKDKEIKKIGMSCMNDLLNDNLARIMGVLFSGGGLTDIDARNPNGNNNFKSDSQAGSFNVLNNVGTTSGGSFITVGDSSVPPTRSQIGLSGNKQQYNTGDGGWNSGLAKISVGALGIATSDFDIKESALFWKMQLSSPQLNNAEVMISRDLISPIVPVLNGQSISVDYSLVLS